MFDFEVSPDGHWAVFRANQAGSLELFAVPILDHGAPRKLSSASLPPPVSYVMSGDSSWVVHKHVLHSQWADYYYLMSSPIDGSAPPKELMRVVSEGFYSPTPDGSYVVGSFWPNASTGWELWSAPMDDSATPVLLVSGTGSCLITSENLAVFSTGAGTHTRPADASTPPVLIAPSLGALGIDPHESRVVCVGSPPALYSVPLDGSQPPVQLTPAFVAGGSVAASDLYVGASRVVYRADQNSDGVFELFSVPITGGTPVALHPPLVSGADVQSGFVVSPDETRVYYTADHPSDGTFLLYGVSILGGTPVVLNGPLAPGGSVQADIALTRKGDRVVYRADQTSAGTIELCGAAADGSGTPIRLNGPLVTGGDVTRYEVAGSRVVYLADQNVDQRMELFSIRADGFGGLTRVNDPFAGARDVVEFDALGNGERVVYRADAINDEKYELFLYVRPRTDLFDPHAVR